MEPVVILDGLTFTYAGSAAPALTDLNLTVQAGEFVTVTGPSGGGKSTLAFCLTGFIPHSFDGLMEGKVIIGGRDTRSCAPGELAGIAGLVQQDPEAQLCTLKATDEVAFGPENLCLPPPELKRRVDWALSAVGASRLADRAVHTLSGGEKQRLAIASVLAMRPLGQDQQRLELLMLITSLRFIPVFYLELSQVRHAQMAKGIDLQRLSLKKFSLIIRYLFVPLVISALSKVDTLTISMESRAFGLYPRRTYLEQQTLAGADRLQSVLIIGASLAFYLVMRRYTLETLY